MSDKTTNSIPIPLQPHKIALVIDGKVQEVLHVYDRLAAILLSEPTIVNITGVDWIIGQTEYDDKTETFTHPDESVQKASPIQFPSLEA